MVPNSTNYSLKHFFFTFLTAVEEGIYMRSHVLYFHSSVLLHFIYFSNSHLIFAYDSLMKSSPCYSIVLLLHQRRSQNFFEGWIFRLFLKNPSYASVLHYVLCHSFHNLILLFYFTFFRCFLSGKYVLLFLSRLSFSALFLCRFIFLSQQKKTRKLSVPKVCM